MSDASPRPSRTFADLLDVHDAANLDPFVFADQDKLRKEAGIETGHHFLPPDTKSLWNLSANRNSLSPDRALLSEFLARPYSSFELGPSQQISGRWRRYIHSDETRPSTSTTANNYNVATRPTNPWGYYCTDAELPLDLSDDSAHDEIPRDGIPTSPWTPTASQLERNRNEIGTNNNFNTSSDTTSARRGLRRQFSIPPSSLQIAIFDLGLCQFPRNPHMPSTFLSTLPQVLGGGSRTSVALLPRMVFIVQTFVVGSTEGDFVDWIVTTVISYLSRLFVKAVDVELESISNAWTTMKEYPPPDEYPKNPQAPTAPVAFESAVRSVVQHYSDSSVLCSIHAHVFKRIPAILREAIGMLHRTLMNESFALKSIYRHTIQSLVISVLPVRERVVDDYLLRPASAPYSMSTQSLIGPINSYGCLVDSSHDLQTAFTATIGASEVFLHQGITRGQGSHHPQDLSLNPLPIENMNAVLPLSRLFTWDTLTPEHFKRILDVCGELQRGNSVNTNLSSQWDSPLYNGHLNRLHANMGVPRTTQSRPMNGAEGKLNESRRSRDHRQQLIKTVREMYQRLGVTAALGDCGYRRLGLSLEASITSRLLPIIHQGGSGDRDALIIASPSVFHVVEPSDISHELSLRRNSLRTDDLSMIAKAIVNEAKRRYLGKTPFIGIPALSLLLIHVYDVSKPSR